MPILHPANPVVGKECPTCKLSLNAGDEVAIDSEGDAWWFVHAGCVEDDGCDDVLKV